MAGEVNVGTLKATLTIDNKGYTEGLKDAGTQTASLDAQTANLATSIFVAEKAFEYGKIAVNFYTDAMLGAYAAVKDFNAMTGTSVEQGGKWQDMMEGMGLQLSDVTMAFRILSNNIEMALGDGDSSAAKAFNRLGVSLKDSNGNIKDSNTLLLETISALQKIPAGTERNSLAMDTLGRSYMNLNKLLNNSKDAMELYNEAQNTVTDTGMEKFNKFEDAMNKFNDAVDDTKVGIGEGLLPMLTLLVNALNDYILPAVNAVGEQFQRMGYFAAAAFVDPLGFVQGKYNETSFQKARSDMDAVNKQKSFLKSAKGTVLPSGSPSSSSSGTKNITPMGTIDEEIEANLKSIAAWQQSIETKKAINEDYTDDKKKLDELMAANEVLVAKSTNKTLQKLWMDTVTNIQQNPVKAVMDIQMYLSTIKSGPGSATIPDATGWDSWVTKGVGSYGSDMWKFMKAAYTAGMDYQAALNAWSNGGSIDAETGKLVNVPGYALGGPVMANSPYIVGERGPELFIPSQSGNILPNGAMMHVHVDIDGNEIGSAVVDLLRMRTGAKI